MARQAANFKPGYFRQAPDDSGWTGTKPLEWRKQAELQGAPGAENEVTACARAMSKDESDGAENAVKQFPKQGNQLRFS